MASTVASDKYQNMFVAKKYVNIELVLPPNDYYILRKVTKAPNHSAD
jgi:hypothetical protein